MPVAFKFGNYSRLIGNVALALGNVSSRHGYSIFGGRGRSHGSHSAWVCRPDASRAPELLQSAADLTPQRRACRPLAATGRLNVAELTNEAAGLVAGTCSPVPQFGKLGDFFR